MTQSGSEGLEREPSLYDYLLILLKYKWFIAISVSVAFVGSMVACTYMPEEYSATASIMPADPVKTVGLLGSFNVRDALIVRMKIEAPTVDDARRKLNGMITIRKISGGIVTITVVHADPERAAGIANGMVSELNRFNAMSITSAGNLARVFAEERLEEVKSALVEAEGALLKFEVDNKELTLFNLLNNVAESANKYLMKKQMEQPSSGQGQKHIEELKGEILGLRDEILGLRDEILGLREMLVGFQVGKMKNRSDLMAKPGYSRLVLKHSLLTRNAQIQQALYGALSRQYQEAKLQEMWYVPAVEVLDIAKVPQIKSGPNRTLIVEASVLAAFLFSVFISFLIELLGKARRRAIG